MQHPHRHPKTSKKYQWNAQHPISMTPLDHVLSRGYTSTPRRKKQRRKSISQASRSAPSLGFFAVFGTVDVDNYGQGWSNPCINFKRWYFFSQDSKRTGLLQRGPRRNNGKAYLEDSQVYSFGFLFIQFLSARILASLRGKLLQRLPLA